MTGKEIGRLPANMGSPAKLDAPQQTVQAILSKQDEIIAKMNQILAAIEGATDASSLFTALDTAEIKAQLEVVELTL